VITYAKEWRRWGFEACERSSSADQANSSAMLRRFGDSDFNETDVDYAHWHFYAAASGSLTDRMRENETVFRDATGCAPCELPGRHRAERKGTGFRMPANPGPTARGRMMIGDADPATSLRRKLVNYASPKAWKNLESSITSIATR